MVFWCLFAFITSGYEHSIANMTLLTVGILSPNGAAVSLSGYFYNLLVAIVGNMVGGILFIAVPYHLISKQKEV
jgi:nitrite transporter NirC